MLVVQRPVFRARTGQSVYAGSTVTGGLCQDWSVSVGLVVQLLVICARTGQSVYTGSTVDCVIAGLSVYAGNTATGVFTTRVCNHYTCLSGLVSLCMLVVK